MASGFLKLATIIMVLNIFMYLGVNFAITAEGNSGINENYNFYFKGDLISLFVGDETVGKLESIANDTKNNWTNYGITGDGAVFTEPEQVSGETIGEGGISYIDALAVLWAIVPTMGNIVLAPLTLFFNFGMPVFIGLMLGIPYIFMLGLSFYLLLGGRE